MRLPQAKTLKPLSLGSVLNEENHTQRDVVHAALPRPLIVLEEGCSTRDGRVLELGLLPYCGVQLSALS